MGNMGSMGLMGDMVTVFLVIFFENYPGNIWRVLWIFVFLQTDKGGLITAPMGIGPGVSAFLCFSFLIELAILLLYLQVFRILLYTKLLHYNFLHLHISPVFCFKCFTICAIYSLYTVMY